MRSRSAGFRVRTVPLSSTESGMVLWAWPPWMVQMEMTTELAGLVSRETRVCRPMTMAEAATTGSRRVWQWAAWPPLPLTLMWISSALARMAP